jgi:tRNA(fMet)-specific endonuclease VapC
MAHKIMIDTSAYSAFMVGRAELKEVVQQADEIFLNPVIVGELLAAFVKGKNERRNRGLLRRFLSSPRVVLVDLDEETSERYATIINHLWSCGTPIPTNDIWIAATAMQYGLRLVTSDAHFQNVPHIITEFF